MLSLKEKNIIKVMIGGLLLALSLNHSTLWWLSFFGLIPLINAIYKNNFFRQKSLFLFGFLFGIPFFGVSLAWSWHAIPLNWLGAESEFLEFSLVFLFWFLTIILFSLFTGGFSYVASLVNKYFKQNPYINLFFLPIIWVIFEYLRACSFTIANIGESSISGPHYSFEFLGYSIASNNYFLQIASIKGVYALSFSVVLINTLIFLFIQNIKKEDAVMNKSFIVLFCLLIIFLITPNFLNKNIQNNPKRNKLNIALINTDFESKLSRSYKESKDKFINIFNIINEVITKNPNVDIIILPEDSRFLTLIKNFPEYEKIFSKKTKGKKMLIIDSSRVGIEKNTYLRLVYLNTKTNEKNYYDKNILVPYGEYLPYLAEYILKKIDKEMFSKLRENRSYSKGDKPKIFEFKENKIGSLFCSEIFSTFLYKELSQEQNADILVNVSSHSWFHNSKILKNQVLNIAKVHAVQNRKYFFHSGNKIQSFVLNQKGEIVKESSKNKGYILYTY